MTREELIQGYFKNTLSDSEVQSLKKRLKTDADFKAEFEDYENIHLAFIENEKKVLKERLKNLDNTGLTESKSWLQSSWLRYAAASIIVIGLCYTFLFQNSESMYETYFDVYPNVEQPVVRNSSANNDGFLAYENANYQKAVIEFESLLESIDNPNIRFYYAMSLMNLGNINDAGKQLESLLATDFEYKAETLWYNALIYVKKDNIDLAIANLKTLDSSNSSFKSKERKLLLQKLED
ncbi:hypothetical protein [Winogradskyella sp. PG-2]|uniref:hypothetical protein n=1 Tax=Winogradskyella sp. PG-2 TaxID=754409 RepID=UPI0004587BF8|nr:hypothetical protein [Winogradskyella sp. PG-2]BAO75183.1 hypothetical protein WPG_0953 [Winogradskyella sp. PG-2]